RGAVRGGVRRPVRGPAQRLRHRLRLALLRDPRLLGGGTFRGPRCHPHGGGARDPPLLLRAGAAPDVDLHPSRDGDEPARREETRLTLRGSAPTLDPHDRGLARLFLLRAARGGGAPGGAEALEGRTGARVGGADPGGGSAGREPPLAFLNAGGETR